MPPGPVSNRRASAELLEKPSTSVRNREVASTSPTVRLTEPSPTIAALSGTGLPCHGWTSVAEVVSAMRRRCWPSPSWKASVGLPETVSMAPWRTFLFVEPFHPLSSDASPPSTRRPVSLTVPAPMRTGGTCAQSKNVRSDPALPMASA